MKRTIMLLVVAVYIGFSCSNDIGLEVNSVQNSNWLYYDFGDCKDIYSFADSTYTSYSCEMMESFTGIYWFEKDTIYLLIPKPHKIKILVGGDSVEVYSQRLYSYRPTLEKMYYRNDTLFLFEIYNNYQEHNQKKFTDFDINYLTRMKPE